jgi:hypothetical protein
MKKKTQKMSVDLKSTWRCHANYIKAEELITLGMLALKDIITNLKLLHCIILIE